MQFKAYFRNIFHQTGRNASLVCKCITLAKLLVAKLKHDMPHSRLRDHELLQAAVRNISNVTSAFAPALAVQVRPNPTVDESLLPANAKRLRKRPAHA